MKTPGEIIALVEPPGALGEPLKGALGNRAAKAIHEALDYAGYVIVPKEPTEAMLIAARDWSLAKYGRGVGNDGADGCWKAMTAATQNDR
ncbi:MAG: hypothetical protein QNK44_07905 [Hyphomicrobiaceae bacterium]|nr:hypothetical protein [Hyphomicrobiaceae bacterium]